MEKLNILFCSFPDFCGNAKALYNYMIKRYKNKMNYYWVVYDKNSINILNEKNTKVVLKDSKEMKTIIKNIDIIFSTHANLIEYKNQETKAIYIDLWHGIGFKPVGYLTKNLSSQDKEWVDSVKEKVDYFIVPTEFWRIIFAATFNINYERILNLGLPLFDEIIYSNGKDNLSKILGIDVNKYKKIIMYMPTFKMGCGRTLLLDNNKKNILNLKEYKEEKLLKYLEENNYLLIIKRHPSDEDTYDIYNNDNIKNIEDSMLTKYALNVNNILNASDMLLTDYSSIGKEYQILNRPVVYLNTDLDKYKNLRGIIFDDYNFWTENNTCNNIDSLLKIIDKQVGTKMVSKYNNLMFGELKDGGCKNICDYIFDGLRISSYIKRNDDINGYLKEENRKLVAMCEEKDNIIKELKEKEERLKQIEQSRSFRLLERVRKMKKRK